MTTLTPGEFPDFEQVLCDLLTPIATAVTTLPQTATAIQSALPLIWVRKTGGTLDMNAITYTAQVQAVVFGTTRAQAQTLAIQVRDTVLAAPAATISDGVVIDYVEEITSNEPKFHAPILRRSRGLMEVPDLDPLNQMVELSFRIDARRQ
ncbi:hypothetical protein [Nocardia sp. BMG111209]|uniref:phage tail termination protein n=1 Tax=Nocardia sp. BMG111209 TaxID=1160137 RepID=UPI00037E2D59|nr:hypothetical protein [Nocardia sp. BMG111209]